MFAKMRNPIATVIFFLLAFSIFCDGTTNAYNVLMATMGGTKSHTIPFVALGISLKTRGHNVTLLSAFPGPAANNGLQEFVPPIFEAYVGNYTSEWDLVGARFRDEMPISPWDAMRYAWESCEALLRDEISVAWLRRGEADSRKRWDVAVVDGAFPECLLGVLHGEGVPIIMHYFVFFPRSIRDTERAILVQFESWYNGDIPLAQVSSSFPWVRRSALRACPRRFVKSSWQPLPRFRATLYGNGKV